MMILRVLHAMLFVFELLVFLGVFELFSFLRNEGYSNWAGMGWCVWWQFLGWYEPNPHTPGPGRTLHNFAQGVVDWTRACNVERSAQYSIRSPTVDTRTESPRLLFLKRERERESHRLLPARHGSRDEPGRRRVQ